MPILEFRTSDGVRVPAISEAQMREVDRVAIEETGPSQQQMMENAGLLHERTGELWLADIGIPRETYKLTGIAHESPFAEHYRVRIQPVGTQRGK